VQHYRSSPEMADELILLPPPPGSASASRAPRHQPPGPGGRGPSAVCRRGPGV